jgi:hypothetical protein
MVNEDKWKPDWRDVRSVRAWLRLIGQSFDAAAQVLEGGVQMLKGLASTVRAAMPPLPDGVEDLPAPEPTYEVCKTCGSPLPPTADKAPGRDQGPKDTPA